MKQQDKVFMIMGATVITLTATVAGVYLFAKDDTASSLSTPTVTTATMTTTPATTTAPVTSTSASQSTTTATSTTSSSNVYKDGTYSATATYHVPHGSNSITAKITVASDKITDVSVTNNYGDQESAMYIDSFVSSLKSTVVGQSIGSLSVSRIGGATLTTNGFSSALSSIISQAKA